MKSENELLGACEISDAMVEKLEILRDIEIANKQFANGQCVPQAEARRMLTQ